MVGRGLMLPAIISSRASDVRKKNDQFNTLRATAGILARVHRADDY